MSLSVTPTARDITFTFPNSCNSKCCIPSEPTLYVNSQGQLETYKQRKARHNTEAAFNRSISHLNATLERRVTSFQGDPTEFQGRAGSILESIYALKTVNGSHIEALNELMIDYFNATPPKQVRFDIVELEEKPLEPEISRCLIL